MKMDKETTQYIREGKKLQVKSIFETDLFAALGGSLPETTMARLLDKIDQVYNGESSKE